jgi:hypothetical protein
MVGLCLSGVLSFGWFYDEIYKEEVIILLFFIMMGWREG